MTKPLAIGIAFGLLAAIAIGHVKTARIDNARQAAILRGI